MAPGTVQTEVPNSNYYKFHSCIFVVTKREMCRIYLWLYKGSRQYVGDYIRTENLVGQMRLGRHEKVLLDAETSVATFDISFLYTLLRFTCGLSPAGDRIWNGPEESQRGSLEHILYRLKEIRNSLSHESEDLMYMTLEDLRDREEELSELLARALELAGEKSARRDEASRAIAKMKGDLQAIISDPIPSGFTLKNFAALGRQEMRGLCAPVSGAFAEVVVQQAQTATTTTASAPELPLNQLLRWSCEDTKLPHVILVTGDTGTGKTSLCRYIFDSWGSGDDTLVDLQECDLVVSIQCSEVFTSDVVRLLEDSLPRTVKACGPSEVLEKLSSLKVLWLVDGYEEATREARGLLKCLVEKRDLLHTILVTTRPEHSLEFINEVGQNASLLEVRLLGLSTRGRNMVAENVLQEPPTSMKKLEDFERELSLLESEVSTELLNPLKLTLTVKLWKEDIIDMKEGGTLPQLYSSIKKVHIKSLCDKTKNRTGMIVQECNRKVNKWVAILCEEAFNMTKLQKYMELTEEMQDTLQTACDQLGLSSEDCFSTFLGYRPSATAKSGLRCYTFLHNTQQFHYAAEHVLLQLSKSTDEVKTVYQIFGYKTQCEIGSQFYMVLLHVMALLSASGTVENKLAKALVKLFLRCGRRIWFEVIRYAAYSNDVVAEVCNVMPHDWGVGDIDIRAARQCLGHKSPKTILITLNADPAGNEECMPMVKIIAQSKIIVHLLLNYTFPSTAKLETSDAILEILCSKDATCTIARFDGCVSGRGCFYIRKMPNVHNLTLKFLRNVDLGMVLKVIKHLQHLQSFTMVMAMPELNLQKRLTISGIPLKVHLPLIRNYNINKTATSLKNISKKYDLVYFHHSKPERMYTLMTDLGQKHVKISCVKWLLRTQNHLHEFSLGSVPLAYSYGDFIHLCNIFVSVALNTESEVKM